MKKIALLKIAFPLLLFIVALPTLMVPTGCANIIPPTGGPRDSLPPVVVAVRPPDSAKNFVGKRIVFEFNEYVQLDNVQENLLVSPTPKINPSVESKLRTVTLQIKDTLEPNTTYTINFGNAIKDINEGNVLREFTYVFSTGNRLDSLQLSGKVFIAETGKTDSTLIVMLHTSQDDSAVIKDRPRYIARVNKEGVFHFRNLPRGTFALYALKDEGGQHKYLSKSQLFAFADKPVTTGDTTSAILYAYTEKYEEIKKPATPTTGNRRADNKAAAAAAADKRLRIEMNLPGGELDLLGNLDISFNAAPLKTFDSTKVQLTDEKFQPITNYRLLRDTSNKKVTLVHNWAENTAYHLILNKDFAEDTAGRKLIRTDTIDFRTKKQGDYGLIRLRLLNLDLSRNPVLQFVQNDQVKYSYVLVSREFNAKLFNPGDYDLRILYDDNKNGKWDPGNFFGKHLQPEKVQPLSRKLTVKANWDNEIDITL